MANRGTPQSTRGATELAARRDLAAPRDIQELWFALARWAWRSIVLVPADAGASAAAIAAGLGQVANQLHDVTVSVFTVPSAERPVAALPESVDCTAALHLVEEASPPKKRKRTHDDAPRKVIVSIPPVVVEPLGLAVSRAADLVVLCVDLGKTSLRAVRRTIDLVGRERIAGCILSGASA